MESHFEEKFTEAHFRLLPSEGLEFTQRGAGYAITGFTGTASDVVIIHHSQRIASGSYRGGGICEQPTDQGVHPICQ